jgi:putative redox protein
MPTQVTAHGTFVNPDEGLRVEAVSGSGFAMGFDSAPVAEGGVAASPTETVLAALMACTAMDVASILRKKRQPFLGYQIHATAEKRDEHPQVFTSIVIEHRLVGAMTVEAVRRSIELSATAYCPVSAMLSASVHIEHRYLVQRPEDGTNESGSVVVTGPAGGRALGASTP